MRLLIDMAQVSRGGMERQAISLGGGLRDRGHEVVLVAHKRILDYSEEILEAGIEAVACGIDGRWDFRILGALRNRIRDFGPDVVLTENFNATLWGRMGAILEGVPVVTAEHTTGGPVELKVLVTNRLLGARTSAIVACAEAQRDFLIREGNPGSKIVVIPNGIDADRYSRDPVGARGVRTLLGIAEDTAVIGMMAAHRPEKRHDRLLQIVAHADLSRRVHAIAVGGGPLLEINRAAAAVAPVAKSVSIVGPQSDVVAYYSAMDLMVLPSDLETFPMALLEAQACGTPVVAFDVGGVREAVAPGAGWVVDAGDIDELARVTSAALDDPESLRRKGIEAQEWVRRHHGASVMVDKFESLLKDVIRRA